LLEVVEAIDGPILINECVNDTYQCSQHGCPMRSIWQEAQSDLINRLKNTTFGQFLPAEA
jgi:DNA-binding IscR family transcriptional regulator